VSTAESSYKCGFEDGLNSAESKLAEKDAEIAALKAEVEGMRAFLGKSGLYMLSEYMDMKSRAEAAEAKVDRVREHIDKKINTGELWHETKVILSGLKQILVKP
jgi:hypothetical protein